MLRAELRRGRCGSAQGGRAVAPYTLVVRLRDLPSVDELARTSDDPLAVEAARIVLARAREEIQAGSDPGDLQARVADELGAARSPRLRRALNATGIIVHTNLGRAPLSEAALDRVREVGRGYSNLEYDLSAGTRGSRQDHVAGILRRLTGAEAALVVNNNAAAVLLALAALAEGRDVLVSRGERGRLRAGNQARDGGPAPCPPVELPARRLHGAPLGRGPGKGRATARPATRRRPRLRLPPT